MEFLTLLEFCVAPQLWDARRTESGRKEISHYFIEIKQCGVAIIGPSGMRAPRKLLHEFLN